MIVQTQLGIHSYGGEGYTPLMHYEKWRIAELRYCEELLPQNISRFQRHNKTDEAFILLAGHCTLFLGGNAPQIGEIDGQPMKPLKVYNIHRGTWHSHTLSPDATVLIIENEDTCGGNSPEQELMEEQKVRLIAEADRCAQTKQTDPAK
jgi:ureidoglycolate hydrolase